MDENKNGVSFTMPVTLRDFKVPMLAHIAPDKDEQFRLLASLPLTEVPADALDKLAMRWLDTLYSNAKRMRPWIIPSMAYLDLEDGAPADQEPVALSAEANLDMKAAAHGYRKMDNMNVVVSTDIRPISHAVWWKAPDPYYSCHRSDMVKTPFVICIDDTYCHLQAATANSPLIGGYYILNKDAEPVSVSLTFPGALYASFAGGDVMRLEWRAPPTPSVEDKHRVALPYMAQSPSGNQERRVYARTTCSRSHDKSKPYINNNGEQSFDLIMKAIVR